MVKIHIQQFTIFYLNREFYWEVLRSVMIILTVTQIVAYTNNLVVLVKLMLSG